MANNSEAKELYSLINGHTLSKIIMLACELRLDEIITDEPLSILLLAERCGFHPQAMQRFLRVLDAHEIVILDDENHVKRGRLGLYLNKVRSPQLVNGYSIIYELLHSLKSNQECYSQYFGKPFYPHVKESEVLLKDLEKWGYQSAHDWLIPTVLNSYDFSRYTSICEIGNQGYLLASILEKYSMLRGEVADHNNLPDCEIYIYFRTLLGLTNEEIIEQLRKIHSTRPTCQLLIIDFFMPEKNHPDYRLSTIADINILTCLGGSLRTMKEWLHLIKQTSFKNIREHSLVKGLPELILPLFIITASI